MIDIATVEEYMRAANPIPTLDAVDAEELAFAVAAVDTRRAAAMQAPTQHPTETTPTTPPSRRRSVWAFAAAFVLILVVVGAAALLLSDGGAPPADELTPTTTLETATTIAEAPPSTVAYDDTGRWQATKLSEPWTQSIVDVASLPSGGFVVVYQDYGPHRGPRGGRIIWSPDGVEWFDADPQQQINATTAAPREELGDHLPAVISVMGDRVVVLDGDLGLWVGDPRAGEWESIRLDTTGIAGQVTPYAVASNDTEVLVLAEHRPKLAPEDIETVSQRAEFESAEKGDLVWLVNPQTGDVEWRSLPPTRVDPETPETEDLKGKSGAVAWVNDRWVIALDDAILVSGDGSTWTQIPDEDTFDYSLWTNALTASPIGVIATTCEGLGRHYAWFSEDGLNWENTYLPLGHAEPAYTDGLGFLIVDGETHEVHASHDGHTWHTKTWHFAGSDPSWSRYADDGDLNVFEIKNLAASGQTVFVEHYEGDEGAFLLTYE